MVTTQKELTKRQKIRRSVRDLQTIESDRFMLAEIERLLHKITSFYGLKKDVSIECIRYSNVLQWIRHNKDEFRAEKIAIMAQLQADCDCDE